MNDENIPDGIILFADDGELTANNDMELNEEREEHSGNEYNAIPHVGIPNMHDYSMKMLDCECVGRGNDPFTIKVDTGTIASGDHIMTENNNNNKISVDDNGSKGIQINRRVKRSIWHHLSNNNARTSIDEPQSPLSSTPSKNRTLSIGSVGEALKRITLGLMEPILPDAISPSSPNRSPRIYTLNNKYILNSSYDFMKDHYAGMSSTDVIEAERKRKTDGNIFSPKLIIEHLNKDGKLSEKWKIDQELIIRKERETSGTWMYRLDNLMH